MFSNWPIFMCGVNQLCLFCGTLSTFCSQENWQFVYIYIHTHTHTHTHTHKENYERPILLLQLSVSCYTQSSGNKFNNLEYSRSEGIDDNSGKLSELTLYTSSKIQATTNAKLDTATSDNMLTDVKESGEKSNLQKRYVNYVSIVTRS